MANLRNRRSSRDCPNGCTTPSKPSSVVYTRKHSEPSQASGQVPLRRRRECPECGHLWTTYEVTQGDMNRLTNRNSDGGDAA